MEQVTLKIEGMSCGHCVAAVKGALEGLEGVQVEEVRVGAARVSYDPGAVSMATMAHAIEEQGYEVAG